MRDHVALDLVGTVAFFVALVEGLDIDGAELDHGFGEASGVEVGEDGFAVLFEGLVGLGAVGAACDDAGGPFATVGGDGLLGVAFDTDGLVAELDAFEAAAGEVGREDHGQR